MIIEALGLWKLKDLIFNDTVSEKETTSLLLYRIPFHYGSEEFVQSVNSVDHAKRLINRKTTDLDVERTRQCFIDWNGSQDLYPVESVRRFVKSHNIVSCFVVDGDEEDTYLIVKN